MAMMNRAELQRLADLLDEATGALDAATWQLQEIQRELDGVPPAEPASERAL